jgi:hypothetical protein
MWRSMAFLAAFSVSGAAFAEGFDYNYLDASYGQVEIDAGGSDVDGDGFGIGGSFALTDSFHVFGGYDTADFDFGIDATDLELGVGYNMPMSDTVDFIASLSYLWTEVDTGFGSVDDNGFGLGVGLRAMASPAFELNGGVSYVDYGSGSDGDTAFGGGFLYHFSDAFAVGLSGEWGDDISTYALNGRFSFGQ